MYAQTGNFFSAKYIICCGICAELPTKGGMFSDTPKGSKSCMVNPLSAVMESFPWNGKFNKPLLTAISLSETLPVYMQLAIESNCSTRRNVNQPFQGCVVFIVTK